MRRGKAITTGSTARSSVPDAAREVLELFPSGNCISGSQQVGNNDPRDDYMVSSTRTSIKQIYDVISSLDEFKRELVKSIGFGGMLLFPSLRQINRRFAVWLMSRVDPLTQTLVIDSKKKIKFGKTDVERVFGIPCSGSIISETGMARRDIISKVTTVYLGEDSRQSRSIKTAQEVVERKYNNKMTEAEQAAFKVAFVIYIMSTLLSPGSKYNYVSVDYWSALVEPCSIGKFDWSEYVIRKLFQAVVKLKTELQVSNRVSNITGCSIFLQVLYLDSIDVGVMNMEHSTFPRISSFSAETIKSMVLADSLCRSGGSSDFEFGKSQLRNASGICYSWAYESFSACCGGIGSSLPGLWEISVSFSRALGVHMKAAGALFFAVAEFEMMSSRHEANHAGSIASVLTKIIEPFTNGYCYDAGRDINMAWLVHEAVAPTAASSAAAVMARTNEIPLARDNGPLTVLSAEQTANAAQHVAPVEGAYGLGINNFWTSMLGSSSSTAQPQVPIDLKSNVFGAMNPFEAIGTGRSFLKHFDALFINHLDCPEGFGSDLVMDVLPAVHVRGASPLVFQVGVEIVGNCIRLSTGWSLFVESEKIVSGDYGLFVLSAPHTLEMKLFDSNGNEKPMSARPPAWNLFVAYGEEDGHPNPPPAQDDVNLYAVPEHLLGMQYELGPKLMMTGPLMQALSDVWINFETHFPLYACKLNHSHVNGGTFYFTTNFSNTLPTGHKIVTLSHPADDHLFAATLRKRTGNTGLALISGPGWKDFVKHYGFQLGDLVVLSIRLYLGRLLVRVFRLPIV